VTARRALAVLLATLSLCCLAHGVGAQTPAPGVQYLTDLQDALNSLPSQAGVPRDDPQLRRVRAPLTQAAGLTGDAAALAPVLEDLDRDPADVAGARTRLQTLIAAYRLPPNSVAEDPRAAQQTLHDVYAQDRYNDIGHHASSGNFFSNLGTTLLNALRWIVSHTVGTLGLVPTLILALLAILAIVVLAVRRLQGAGTRALPGRIEEPRVRGIDPDHEWRLAEDAAARGDHREAIRHAFRSALLGVAARGRLHVDAAWTTSELLARARGDADLVAALAPAAASFDVAWYSGRPVSQQDWEVARERCAAVRRLAQRRGVSA
jgi:Domain of unknown function (DUF4129)